MHKDGGLSVTSRTAEDITNRRQSVQSRRCNHRVAQLDHFEGLVIFHIHARAASLPAVRFPPL